MYGDSGDRMNQKTSKLVKKYAVALGYKQSEQYRTTLEKTIKKTWNKTPRNERFKFRKRMRYVIGEHERQLEKDSE